MIDRQGGQIMIECDTCDQVFEGEKDAEFAAVWGAARREGWQTRKIGMDWVHGCPACGAPK